MSVVKLTTGKPVDRGPPKGPALVDLLRKLILSIEDGSLKIECFYLIADCGGPTRAFDNGLTVKRGNYDVDARAVPHPLYGRRR